MRNSDGSSGYGTKGNFGPYPNTNSPVYQGVDPPWWNQDYKDTVSPPTVALVITKILVLIISGQPNQEVLIILLSVLGIMMTMARPMIFLTIHEILSQMRSAQSRRSILSLDTIKTNPSF